MLKYKYKQDDDNVDDEEDNKKKGGKKKSKKNLVSFHLIQIWSIKKVNRKIFSFHSIKM